MELDGFTSRDHSHGQFNEDNDPSLELAGGG